MIRQCVSYIAQIPVPVPTSSALWIFFLSSGER